MKTVFSLLFLLFLGQIHGAELIWNKKNFREWQNFSYCTGKVVDGNLVLSDIRFDSRINNVNCEIDPRLYNALSIRYRAENISLPSSGEFFFVHAKEKFSEKRMWRIPTLKADGKWHTLVISPRNLDSWLEGGKITALRLDPVNKPGGKIEISEIRLFQKREVIRWEGAGLLDFTPNRNIRPVTGQKNYTFSITGPDCRLLNTKVDFDPRNYNTFVMIYRADGLSKSRGELYFARKGEGFSDTRKWNIPALVSNGKWQTLILTFKDLTGKDAWNSKGNISRLRLDPVNLSGGKIEIAEIRFEKRSAAAVEQIKKSSAQVMDAPVWPVVKPELQKKSPVKKKEYFTGFMVRAPQDTLNDKKQTSFFLRKEFFLKSQPVHARIQFSADDCAQVFINGRSCAYSNSWRKVESVNVIRHLKAGKNVLAVNYVNSFSYGGVICELYLQYADGSFERIASDKSFRCGVKEEKNWNTVSFDDSGWLPAVEQPAPPHRPWTVVLPYIFFENLQSVTSAAAAPQKVRWEEKVVLKLISTGSMPAKDLDVDIAFYQKNRQIWKEKLTLNCKTFRLLNKTQWQVSFDYVIPRFIQTGECNIRLESNQLAMAEEAAKNLKISIFPSPEHVKFRNPPVCKVVRKNNVVYAELNGKPFFMHGGCTSERRLANAPFSVVSLSFEPELWHPGTGVYNTGVLDKYVIQLARLYPESHILFTFALTLPHSWVTKYPEEMCVDESGKIHKSGTPHYSYASRRARQDLTANLLKIMEHIENAPYANRVIGYRIGSGETSEWLGWRSSTGKCLDFSKIAQSDFKAYAKKYYPDLKNVHVPTDWERRNIQPGVLMWDPKQNLNTVAYFRYFSNAVADMLIATLSEARNFLKKRNTRKLVGTYYGYCATLGHGGNAQSLGHFALAKVLESGTVDFLMSPQSYPLRNLGDTCGDMKPFAAINDYNVISLCEDDTRTHHGIDIHRTPGSRSQTITEKQSIAVMRRNMGIALIRNQPNIYLTMGLPRPFDFPAMAKDMKIRSITGEFCTARKIQRNAEVAMVVSEDNIASVPHGRTWGNSGVLEQFYNPDGTVECRSVMRSIPSYENFVGNQARLARTGAPVDCLMAETLHKNKKNYKVYVFLNCFNYDEKFLETIQTLQKRGAALLWVYAPGYSFKDQADVSHMKRLTGFDLHLAPKAMYPMVKLADGSRYGTSSIRVKPLYCASEKEGVVLGRYEDGSAGVVMKKIGNSMSYFSGPWQMSVAFLRDVFKRAGVHLYSDTTDPLEANDNLLVIHARFAGKKTIRLPRKTTVLDVYGKKIIGENTDTFTFNMELHETRLFYFGEDAEILLAGLKKQ